MEGQQKGGGVERGDGEEKREKEEGREGKGSGSGEGQEEGKGRVKGKKVQGKERTPEDQMKPSDQFCNISRYSQNHLILRNLPNLQELCAISIGEKGNRKKSAKFMQNLCDEIGLCSAVMLRDESERCRPYMGHCLLGISKFQTRWQFMLFNIIKIIFFPHLFFSKCSHFFSTV